MDDAQIVLRDKVERCSEKTGIAVERINIKNLRKRWESLTKDKKTIRHEEKTIEVRLISGTIYLNR